MRYYDDFSTLKQLSLDDHQLPKNNIKLTYIPFLA